MNTLASKKLADLCVANGVRRYVFASSCSIYDGRGKRIGGRAARREL